MTAHNITDPVERVIADALDAASIRWDGENSPAAQNLDFWLPDYGTHIEVKQFHTPRTASQIERSDSVILIVGMTAARAFADLLTRGLK